MKTTWMVVVIVLLAGLLAATVAILVVETVRIRGLGNENANLRLQIGPRDLEPTFQDAQTQKPTARSLYNAASRGNLARLKTILDQNPEFINATPGTHRATALHASARNGKTAIVEELLRRNADVNAQNTLGFTPLHDAVTSGKTNVVLLLLNSKADLTICNSTGETPLQYAITQNQTQIVDLLRQHGAKE